MTLTRQDIDALVDAMPKGGYCNEAVVLTRGGPDESLMATKDMRRLCYLAAGLTADGSEKAKVVNATLVPHDNETRNIVGAWDVAAQKFTPDGAA